MFFSNKKAQVDSIFLFAGCYYNQDSFDKQVSIWEPHKNIPETWCCPCVISPSDAKNFYVW